MEVRHILFVVVQIDFVHPAEKKDTTPGIHNALSIYD